VEIVDENQFPKKAICMMDSAYHQVIRDEYLRP